MQLLACIIFARCVYEVGVFYALYFYASMSPYEIKLFVIAGTLFEVCMFAVALLTGIFRGARSTLPQTLLYFCNILHQADTCDWVWVAISSFGRKVCEHCHKDSPPTCILLDAHRQSSHPGGCHNHVSPRDSGAQGKSRSISSNHGHFISRITVLLRYINVNHIVKYFYRLDIESLDSLLYGPW